MSDTKLKALIKEEIATILSEEEPPGRYHDQLSSAEVAKDELQTAMLDGAREYLKTVIGKGSDMERRVDPAAFQNRLHHAYSQLEDLLVDAMMNYNVPGVGVDEQAVQPGAEVVEEEAKPKVTHPYMDTKAHGDRWDDEPPAGPPMEPGESEELQQWIAKTRDKKNRR